MEWTQATDIEENKENGTISGYISTNHETFHFTAKLGEWADVEWKDDDDHNYKAAEHRIAQSYATRHFVTNIKATKAKIAAL